MVTKFERPTSSKPLKSVKNDEDKAVIALLKDKLCKMISTKEGAKKAAHILSQMVNS